MADSSWYVKADVKLELEIATGDTADDTYLDDKGQKINRLIDNLISPYITTLPVTTSLSESLLDAAIAGVCEKYRRKNKEFDTANAYKKEFDIIIDSVITRLRRDNETQASRVAVGKAYATEPIASG